MARYRILVVEDDEAISRIITKNLISTGYAAVPVYDGCKAAELVQMDADFDLALLDVMLPGMDGFALLAYMKHHGIPVIYLTAKSDIDSKLQGLRDGAEDYIVKPFEIAELLARVDVVLRRYHKNKAVFEIGGLVIDTCSMQVKKDGEEIRLTKKEYDLLILFVQNPGRALYRDTIYEHVWGGEYQFGSKTVDLHVQRLRRKAGWENILKAVNKVGYRLEV